MMRLWRLSRSVWPCYSWHECIGLRNAVGCEAGLTLSRARLVAMLLQLVLAVLTPHARRCQILKIQNFHPLQIHDRKFRKNWTRDHYVP